jgi:hypothetical protein
MRAWLLCALGAATVVSTSCSDKHAPGPSDGAGDAGATTGGKLAHAGSSATNAGHDVGGAADSTPGGVNASGEDGAARAGGGGTAMAGTSGTELGGAGSNDPIPPVGAPPLCAHSAMHVKPVLLAISGAGNDLLQAITPSDLSLVWKRGSTYFVADRAKVEDAFGTPQQVTGSANYGAVSLSADGLTLSAVTQNLSVVQLTRTPGGAFNDPSPEAGDFEQFNQTISSIPSASQVLSDAVISAGQTSFFFSHYLSTSTGSYATVHESHRSGGSWSFTSTGLGKVLDASDAKRRIPTGVSSDLLTLFYRDEVNGDFRAAWRVNPQVEFDYSEVLMLGDGVQAAAPNEHCSRIYFSAHGATDLDLFVGDVGNSSDPGN